MRMNDRIVLHTLLEGYVGSQRELAQETELSLGAVNNAIKALVSEGYIDEKHFNEYWEACITSDKRLTVGARYAKSDMAFQINSYEDLRQQDYDSDQVNNDATRTIQQVFDVDFHEIEDLHPMKKGYTNDSLYFTIKGQKYIMRLPGLGTENFIDRQKEARIYELLQGKGICTDLTYIDPKKGYKITPFIHNSRCCDEKNPDEVKRCMTIVRRFHELCLTTGDEPMNIFNQIKVYEDLWAGQKSGFRDYDMTKSHCMAMKDFVDKHQWKPILQHGDCNPDNFLLYQDNNGDEITELIDWEYGADGDPLMDLAAFVTYRKNDRKYIEMAIDAYFQNNCTPEDRLLVYCYISLWGLYCSVWCEYKAFLGENYSEFNMSSYYYAKTYYKIFEEEYNKLYGKEYSV